MFIVIQFFKIIFSLLVASIGGPNYGKPIESILEQQVKIYMHPTNYIVYYIILF